MDVQGAWGAGKENKPPKVRKARHSQGQLGQFVCTAQLKHQRHSTASKSPLHFHASARTRHFFLKHTFSLTAVTEASQQLLHLVVYDTYSNIDVTPASCIFLSIFGCRSQTHVLRNGLVSVTPTRRYSEDRPISTRRLWINTCISDLRDLASTKRSGTLVQEPVPITRRIELHQQSFDPPLSSARYRVQ